MTKKIEKDQKKENTKVKENIQMIKKNVLEQDHYQKVKFKIFFY